MSRKVMFVSTMVSAVVGFLAAVGVCLVFFFFVYKPNQTVDIGQQKTLTSPTQVPNATPPTPNPTIPRREIPASEISSLSISPFITDFYEKGSKCSQSYNEVYGNEDRYYSPGPPCQTEITFNRDGSATKYLEMVRWDKSAGQLRVLEKSAWTGKITGEQFNSLAEIIAGNDVFKTWNDGMLINVTTCNIHVKHNNGTRTLMANVDKSTTDFWMMINAFKKLDSEVKWEKSE